MRTRRTMILAVTWAAILVATALALAGSVESGPVGRQPNQRSSRAATGGARRPARRADRVPRLPRSPAAQPWNRAEETTLRGSVQEAPGNPKPPSFLTTMVMEKGDGEVRVLMGPPWFNEALGFNPARRDHLEVVGMLREREEEDRVLARAVTWRGKIYAMRNADGQPLWAGATSASWLSFTEVWDAENKETVRGQVVAVDEMWPDRKELGIGPGVSLRLKLETGGRKVVELGPKWFVTPALPGLKAGQQVTVTGPAVEWDLRRVLVASEVEVNGKKLRLRTEEGLPTWPGGWQDWSGWGPGSSYGRMYDRKTVVTISGTVSDTKRNSPQPDVGQGTVITVRGQDGRVVFAHLAPTWFMQQSRLKFGRSDQVTVIGSIVAKKGRPVMMVSSITVKDQQTQLRGPDGTPVWMAAGRSGG